MKWWQYSLGMTSWNKLSWQFRTTRSEKATFSLSVLSFLVPESLFTIYLQWVLVLFSCHSNLFSLWKQKTRDLAKESIFGLLAYLFEEMNVRVAMRWQGRTTERGYSASGRAGREGARGIWVERKVSFILLWVANCPSRPYSKILFFVSTWDSECSTESCVNLNTQKCKIRFEVCIVR